MPEPFRLTLITPPAALPLSLGEVKSALRVGDDQTLDDAQLMAYLRSAVDAFENFSGRALITQTWTMWRDAWPLRSSLDDRLWEGVRVAADLAAPSRAVEIPKPPLQSVVHVKTYDDSDVATTWAAGNYFVDTASEPGRLVARVGVNFPTTTRAANGIEIQFKAGYGDSGNDVLQPIRDGLLRMVASLYECAGGEERMAKSDLTKAAELLWRPYRIIGF